MLKSRKGDWCSFRAARDVGGRHWGSPFADVVRSKMGGVQQVGGQLTIVMCVGDAGEEVITAIGDAVCMDGP